MLPPSECIDAGETDRGLLTRTEPAPLSLLLRALDTPRGDDIALAGAGTATGDAVNSGGML